MQNAGFTHERHGKLMGSRDGGQFFVEHAGEGEQIVALILQRDAHRANAPCILGLARASSSTMKSNSICRVARAGPASARTSWLNHWVSVRMSRASQYAWASVCRASSS